MRRPAFWVGIALGALAYPSGRILGQVLFHRSVIYPYTQRRTGHAAS